MQLKQEIKWTQTLAQMHSKTFRYKRYKRLQHCNWLLQNHLLLPPLTVNQQAFVMPITNRLTGRLETSWTKENPQCHIAKRLSRHHKKTVAKYCLKIIRDSTKPYYWQGNKIFVSLQGNNPWETRTFGQTPTSSDNVKLEFLTLWVNVYRMDM